MAHTFASLTVHVIFSTKDREPRIDVEIRSELFAYLSGIVRNLKGQALLVNGTADHVHALIRIPPDLSVSDMMRTLKANSSKWVHEKWPQRASFA